MTDGYSHDDEGNHTLPYVNPNDMAHWFPLLAATGVSVPKTEIIKTDLDLVGLLDGKQPEGFEAFLGELAGAMVRVCGGHWPVFLRTGYGSGKHQWDRTCRLEDSGDLREHVYSLVEWSHVVDFMGLPTDTWVVREWLDLNASFTCKGYGGMPVAREVRTFIRDGEVCCHHPYWPAKAVLDGRPDREDWEAEYRRLFHDPRIARVPLELASKVAQQMPGAWSLDFAQAKDGTWYAIDMAQFERSYHWEGCPNDPDPSYHEHRLTPSALDALKDAP